MSPAIFTRALSEALSTLRELSPTAREIVIAQGALESGWGTSLASRLGFNHWNLTAGSVWKGPVIGGGDLEYPPDGGPPAKIVQRFRKYPDHLSACEDYLSFLGTKRYAKALPALLAGDGATFVVELRRAGFFTAPLDSYQLGFAACLARARRILTGELA